MLRPTAQHVVPGQDFSLLITFDNGERKAFDVKPYIKGKWYGRLGDLDYFRQVETDGFTIVWPEGQDLCPDEIYEKSFAV